MVKLGDRFLINDNWLMNLSIGDNPKEKFTESIHDLEEPKE